MRTVPRRIRHGVGAVLAAAGLAGAMMTGTPVPARAATPGVFGWGYNTEGAVGDGSGVNQLSPVPVTLPAAVAQISADPDGQTSAAVLANGTVATWGYNWAGQIGDGRWPTPRLAPFVVPGLAGITQVAVGAQHMLALDSAGTIWSWGANVNGQLGNGTTSSIQGSNPTPVPVPGLTAVTQIAAGSDYSLALRSDGTVWAWGGNAYGQLGDHTTTDRDRPEQVPGLTKITKVIAGYQTSYAIGVGGVLLAWGNNAQGLLGNGTSTGFSAVPAQVPGLTGVTAVSSGGASGFETSSETLAVVGQAGTLWSWGGNAFGQAGDGTTTARSTPAPTSLTGVTRVASGDAMEAAVLSGGQLMTWGFGLGGALGRSGTATGPAAVTVLAGVTQVALGDDFGLAVGTPAPRVPSVIGLTQSEASSALQAAGYVLGRVASIIDITCNYIGEVKTQSPAAGTIAPPGTAVSVGIGRPGGKCLS
jgi:alpha-tubulin suppressor-like RCC1 family protein